MFNFETITSEKGNTEVYYNPDLDHGDGLDYIKIIFNVKHDTAIYGVYVSNFIDGKMVSSFDLCYY